MKLPVLLRIYVNDKLEGVQQFTQQQIVIGRNAEVQLNLKDASVAALHAIIEERDGGYYVSDLGSQTGTLKNGQKVLDEKLESGDEIQVGPYRIQFFIGVPKPTAPPSETTATQEESKTPNSAPVQAKIPESAPSKKEAPVSSLGAVPSSSPPPLQGGGMAAAAMVTTSEPKSKSTAKPKPLPRNGRGTFAPPSKYTDLKEVIKPGKGTVVEVIIAWKERIIGSYHFGEKGTITIGSDPKCNIVLPLLGVARTSHPIVRIDTWATVCVSQEMSGEFMQENRTITFADLVKQGKLRQGGAGYELDLAQGEMVRVGLMGNTISIYVRYVPEAPKPLVAPLLDLTASEVTGVILAIVVAAIFGLYMLIYSPNPLEDEALLEEQLRKAVVTFNIPRKKVEEIKVDDVKQEKSVKVVDMEKKEEKKAPKNPDPKPDPGKAAEVKPFPSKSKEKTLTSAKPGGATKTAPKDGASAPSERPDPTKLGLLGTFGSKGTRSKLDQAYSGAGELTGAADSATGYAGASEDRAGNDMGTKLKNAGAGGKGKATVGISGVGTQGRGSGGYGYGTGGLGEKGNVGIELGGQDATFSGSIDRDAIRRVIQNNRRAIRTCYERALNRDPDLYGKLVLEWDIGEQGRVLRASVANSSLNNSEVANCIISRLKTWRFPEPPPDQTARVLYPFVFTSQ